MDNIALRNKCTSGHLRHTRLPLFQINLCLYPPKSHFVKKMVLTPFENHQFKYRNRIFTKNVNNYSTYINLGIPQNLRSFKIYISKQKTNALIFVVVEKV